MTTTIPSGLGATLGLAAETVYADGTTPDRWYLIDANEGFTIKKNLDQSKALNGSRFMIAKRRVLVTHAATGKFSMDLCANGMGLLFQGVLGSDATATEQGMTAAYIQVHTPGISTQGFFYNFQKGMPETPSGTVSPFSYPGSKITELEITNEVNKIAKVNVTLDCNEETTAPEYAAPTFPTPDVFSFNQGAVLIGGTPSTTDGVVTITDGVAPTGIVSSVSVKITNKMNVDRYNIGAGVKAEPIDSDFVDVTGEIEIEFANLTDFYNAMAADTQTSLQINWTGITIASTYHEEVLIALPAIKWEDATPMATSTDVVKVKVPFTALNDTVDPVIQITYQSTDTAV